jgi:amidohydrolase
MSKILEQAKQLKYWSVKHRRHLHQYPEISLNEKKTSAYCQNILKELGYSVKKSWGYGFTADLELTNAQKRIAFRADMDALPIQEENEHEYKSRIDGVAHLCGHDTHTAIALTTARLLIENKEKLSDNIRFIFQPSEEKPPGGAVGMIKAGCLDGVDEIYGLHNDPELAVGKIKTKVGALMAAGALFDCIVKGKGCHAARPQDGLDPVYAAALLVLEWQSIVSRRLNPAHTTVLSVTEFHAGECRNIIPDKAELEGTFRTFGEKDLQLIEELMAIPVDALKLQGYECKFNYDKTYDPVINEKYGVHRVIDAATGIIGRENIDYTAEPVGWSEDFCYYLQQRPGAFYFLGSGNNDRGINAPLHSPRFDIDEDALPLGAAIMTQLGFTQK